MNTRTYTHKHTPLHLAAQYNHSDIVKLLIDRGAEIQARDINGCTPLHYSATNGHTDSALVLLDSGADPNETNLKENIPLHNAAKWGHAVMVQCLLSHGSVVDTHNADNLSPIQVCVLFLAQLNLFSCFVINISTVQSKLGVLPLLH